MVRAEAAQKLKRIGWKIFNTAGFTYKGALGFAQHTHKDDHVTLEGKFTSEHLRLMADYMDGEMVNPIREKPKHRIPDMTDPLGKHWDQPARDFIIVRDKVAYMQADTYSKLAEYSRSLPSGTYVGKMWKRIDREGKASLVWYDRIDSDIDEILIEYRPIVIVDSMQDVPND